MNTQTQFELRDPGQIRPGMILFSRYLVDSKLGEGGMGTVWLVRHQELGSLRALKLIVSKFAFNPQAHSRFQREARVMARLSHPNAVVVHDAVMSEDAAYIEMEYIRGQGLDQVIRPGVPMSPDRVARLLEQLCDVLQVAHDDGIVHRDLKPSNLMIIEGDAPDRERLKVLDFGIAKIVEGDEFRTEENAILGSTPWISPEQSLGGQVDGRSDIYSIGVILYEMLTSYRPFGGPNNQIIYDHQFTPPPTFAEKNPGAGVPPKVERVVMRCLDKDPENRPHTPRELNQEFWKALDVASSRPARASRVDRGLLRAEDDLMRRLLARLGRRPEATVPPTRVDAPQAQADSEIIGDQLPSQFKTKTSVNRGMPVFMILAAGFLLLICCQPAAERKFELGGVATEVVHIYSNKIYISKYEVTNRQYRNYRVAHRLPAPEKGFDGLDRPAVNVSWLDARDFCKWATERSQGRFTVRLPTEEEWDVAAGAAEAGLAPGKGNFEGTGNEDPFPSIAPGGQFPGNLHGLHDMFGNVWEWVQRESHEGAPEDCRLGVMRGGSFGSELELLRDGARDERPADSRHFTIGFRVVVDPRPSKYIYDFK